MLNCNIENQYSILQRNYR